MNARNKPLFFVAMMMVAIVLFGFGSRVDAAPSRPGFPRQAVRLSVAQTVQATFTRTYLWGLAISAAPTQWNLMDGDEAVSRFTVQVTRTGQKDSDWTVLGTIRIENPTQFSANVADVVGTISPNNQRVNVICSLPLPFQLGAGQSMDCSYQAKTYGPKNGSSRVKVKTTGRVPGDISSADYGFDQPGTEQNAAVRVNAGGTEYGPFEEDVSFNYEKNFNCRQPGVQEEIATVLETGKTSQAEVQVNCFGFEYAKSSQTYRVGQEWGLKGSLDLHNTGAADLWVADVHELVSPDLEAQVDCGHDFTSGATLVGPGETLACTFQMVLPDQAERWNFSRMTVENSHYDADGNRTTIGTTDFLTSPTPLSFSD